VGLVVPRHVEDVVAAVAACRKYGAPVLGRGAGTSLAGQCCNVAVVLDFTKYMNQIVELDPLQQYARVQPGVVLDSLRNKAEAYKLTFAPDPSTHNRCTIGGMIGNNSCGTHSLLGGKTVDNIEELQVLLYDGSLMSVGATSDEELSGQVNGRKAFPASRRPRVLPTFRRSTKFLWRAETSIVVKECHRGATVTSHLRFRLGARRCVNRCSKLGANLH